MGQMTMESHLWINKEVESKWGIALRGIRRNPDEMETGGLEAG